MSGRSALRMAQTDPYVATLFQLIQDEKKQNDLRAHSFQTLNELENMLPDLNGAEDLRAFYQEKMTSTTGDSLVDRFTAAAMTAAKGLGVTFKLSPIDSEVVRSAMDAFKPLVDIAGDQVKEFVEEDDVKQGRETDEPEDDELLDEITVPGLSTEWEEVDGLPEQELVKEEVANHYNERNSGPIFYPGWCAPSTGSISFMPLSAASLIEPSQTSQESNAKERDPPAGMRSASTTSKSSCTSSYGSSHTDFP